MASTPSWPLRLVKMPSTWSRSISGKSVVRDCPTPKAYRAAEWLPGFLRFLPLHLLRVCRCGCCFCYNSSRNRGAARRAVRRSRTRRLCRRSRPQDGLPCGRLAKPTHSQKTAAAAHHRLSCCSGVSYSCRY